MELLKRVNQAEKKPIIFAHVPKTAGTSLRVSLQQVVPQKLMLLDYGPGSNETSGLILDTVYQGNEHELLKYKEEFQFLFGHFQDSPIGLSGYRKLMPQSMLCAVLRDPVARIVSEYHHFRNYFGYHESFDTFFHWKPFKNRQLKAIDSVPLCFFDFVGITEHYSDSLILFERVSGLKLAENRVNTRAHHRSAVPISQSSLDNFARLNVDDITLYNEALTRLYYQLGKGLSLSGYSRFRGNLAPTDGVTIKGWATDYASYRPVKVQVFCDDQEVSQDIACLPRPDIKNAGLHISGYCGFSIPVENLGLNNSNSRLIIRIERGTVLGQVSFKTKAEAIS